MSNLLLFSETTWQQVWGISTIPPDQNKYTRITCPVLLSSPVIALLFSYPGSIIDPWRWAGWVSIEVTTGLVIGGQPSARLNESRKLYVNRLQVFTYPQIVSDYSLIFDSAISGNVSLFAWEYTGEIT